ncbi:MAG: GPW/gp25 family protein [bacterium]
MIEERTLGFPFGISETGRIHATGGDEAIRGKIIQVLFTAPGERINLPEFGCGLFDLIFEPNNTILATAMEFSIGKALSRWLRDDIVLDNVNVESSAGVVTVEIVYTKKQDLSKQAVRIHFK